MKMSKRIALRLAVLVLTIFLIATVCWLAQKLTAPRVAPPLFKATSQFAVGVNYPWRNYGGDFGANVWGNHVGVSTPEAMQEVDSDFAFLSSIGMTVVRWFVFCDGRGGLKFAKDGSIAELDSFVIDDMAAALAIAHKHNIRIIFVLLDFNFAQAPTWFAGQRIGGHRKIIERPDFILSLHNNVLAPILQAFGNSPDVAAWEIINEPEHVMTRYPHWETSKISGLKMQVFVRRTAIFIKAHAKQSVTVGSASRAGLDNWDDCALDFLQFHSYPNLEAKNPLDTPAEALGHSLPILLGEFPTYSTTVSTDQYLELMRRNHYVGALAWSYRASDPYSYLETQLPAIAAWRKAHAAK